MALITSVKFRIGGPETACLRNDLYCVEWDVKLYYTIPYPKRLGMYKFVRTESRTGSKYSEIFFQHLYTGRMDCSCTPMFRFLCVASDGATTQRRI